MSISALAPAPPPSSAAAPAAPVVAPEPRLQPREPGLTALALGLLALTSSVHPLWVLASVVLAIAGAGAGLLALAHPGERRWGAIGLAAAVLAAAVASVTLPAVLQGAAEVLGLIGRLRAGAS